MSQIRMIQTLVQNNYQLPSTIKISHSNDVVSSITLNFLTFVGYVLHFPINVIRYLVILIKYPTIANLKYESYNKNMII